MAVATQCFGLENAGLLKAAWKKQWGPTRNNIVIKGWNSLGEKIPDKNQGSDNNYYSQIKKISPQITNL